MNQPMSEIERKLVGYMLLAQSFEGKLPGQQPRVPREPTLELVEDGWQLWDGKSDQPIPIPVDMAWELNEGSHPGKGGREVMDATRKMCGDLRFAAKAKGPAGKRAAETLAELREGMNKARQLAALHEKAEQNAG